MNRAIRYYIKLIFTMLLLSYGKVYAACVGFGDSQVNFNLGNIVVQSSTPAGTVLATQRLTGNPPTIFYCTTSWEFNLTSDRFTNPSSIANTYQTNIAGIGIRAAYPGAVYMGYRWPLVSGWRIGGTNPYLIEIIKTSAGAVGSGAITPGKFASGSAYNIGYFSSLWLSGTTISAPTCTVLNSSIPVPLGTVPQSKFNGVGSTSDQVDVPIPLNCSAGVRINIMIQGNSAGAGNTSVLALDNPSNSSTAKGVGVQLLNGTTPITLGTAQFLQQSTNGNLVVTLKARYYQISPTITAGDAKATATFTMSYN